MLEEVTKFGIPSSDGESIFELGGPKSNEQIPIAYNPYLACPCVTRDVKAVIF